MRQCRHRNAIALAVSSRVLLFLSRSRPAGLPRSLSRCHYPEAKSPVIGNGSEVTLDYQVIVFGDSGIPYHGTSEFVQGRQAESPLAIEVPGILQLYGGHDMAYSDKVVDHFSNPRNMGSFTKDESGWVPGLSAHRSTATS